MGVAKLKAIVELQLYGHSSKVTAPTRMYTTAVFDGHEDPGHPHGQWSLIFNVLEKHEDGTAKAEMFFLFDDVAPIHRLQEIGNQFTMYCGFFDVGRGKIIGVLDERPKPRQPGCD